MTTITTDPAQTAIQQIYFVLNYWAKLKGELDVSPKQVGNVTCLGIIHRLVLLGAPDMLVDAVVDDEVESQPPRRNSAGDRDL